MGLAWFSSKEPYLRFTGGWLTFWLTVACATDMTLFGYDQCVFSGVVVTQDFLDLLDLNGPSKTQVLSTVTAIYDGTAIMAVGTNLQCSSYSLAQMFVGRVVISLGNGMNTATARIWQTETSPAHWRRRLVILEMVMNIAGFSLVNWIKYGLSFRGGAVAWRIPTAFQFIFIFILFGTVPWLPESPRWLMQQGRTGEAVEVIACIEDKSVDDPYITTQRSEIEYTIQYERDNDVSWRDLFSRKKTNDTNTLRRLLL
ncbi:hypothetical protein M752DRAFT_294703 [Aspergillus phoenicis ATCC 13157]|uniref:General substrate transporter n=1 Tax=Aspergillus phoenicis ATCC 13157 TaxID=1353007 RepID=A0A370PFU0_ASPPH|nr:hypothetical protein M752DRAFT_294703 [Aspergillus phoenicis ATCC 13157]